jgi:hypothetical protein
LMALQCKALHSARTATDWLIYLIRWAALIKAT